MYELIPQALTPEEWLLFEQGGHEAWLASLGIDSNAYRNAAILLACHPQGFRVGDVATLLSAIHALQMAAHHLVPGDPAVLTRLAQQVFEVAQRLAAIMPPVSSAKGARDGEHYEVHQLYQKGADMPSLVELPDPERSDEQQGEEWKGDDTLS